MVLSISLQNSFKKILVNEVHVNREEKAVFGHVAGKMLLEEEREQQGRRLFVVVECVSM